MRVVVLTSFSCELLGVVEGKKGEQMHRLLQWLGEHAALLLRVGYRRARRESLGLLAKKKRRYSQGRGSLPRPGSRNQATCQDNKIERNTYLYSFIEFAT